MLAHRCDIHGRFWWIYLCIHRHQCQSVDLYLQSPACHLLCQLFLFCLLYVQLEVFFLIFKDDTWLSDQKSPETHYELLEHAGRAPDLPPGFSYGPLPLANPAAGEGSELVADPSRLCSVMPLSAEESITIRIPQNSAIVPPKMIEAIMSDPRRIPYGFIGVCPHPGYDPDRPDKNRSRLSSIYGHEITFGRTGPTAMKVVSSSEKSSAAPDFLPPGTTGKRYPVLWPSKER